jgi:SH3-like domain-containing protein
MLPLLKNSLFASLCEAFSRCCAVFPCEPLENFTGVQCVPTHSSICRYFFLVHNIGALQEKDMESLLQKVRSGIAAYPVVILVLASACLVSASAWGVVGQMLTVQVREVQMRSTPSFTGRLAATLAYGQTVSVLEEQGAWTKARSANSEGWVHTSALTDRRLDLASGGRDAASGTDAREVATAGKGFTAETERAYRQSHPDGYAQVEAMQRFRHSPAELQAFLAAGKLVPGQGVAR